MSASFDWGEFGGQPINSAKETSQAFDWSEFGAQPAQAKKEEGTEPARYVGSAVTGIAGMTPYGLSTGALSAVGLGEALGEMDELAERIPELMEKFPQAPWKEGYNEEVFREEYSKGLKDVSETFPTVSNIAKWVEDATGLPFSPKTPFQHLISFLSGGLKIAPGNIGEKMTRTAAGAATRESLIQMGMAPEAADLFGYASLFASKDQVGANLIKKQKEQKAQEESVESFRERKEFEAKRDVPPDEPPPGGGPPGAGSPPADEVVDGRITAPSEFLKSDYEISEDVKRAISPLTIELQQTGKSPVVAREANTLLSPVSEPLNSISPTRVHNPRLIGSETSRTVQRVSNKIYADVNSSWNDFRALASDVSSRREGLVSALSDIMVEHRVPQTQTSAKLLSLAKNLRSAARRGPLSNEELADAIIEARKGFKYDIQGGVESHRINEYIRAIENELNSTMSETEAASYAVAKQKYSDWAQAFKNKKVMPYRFTGISSPRALYRNSMNPDTLSLLIPILEQDATGRGATLANLLRRSLLENSLSPFLTNLKNVNPFRLQSKLGELKGIIDDNVLSDIEKSIAQAHAQAIQSPPAAPKGYRSRFLDMDENQLSRTLDKVSGLKELERELSRIPGGKEQFEIIKKTKGIDLLFGGQMDISSRSNKLSKLLNDRNGQHYIKYTLGENVYRELKVLDKKNQIESAIKKIEHNKELYDIATDPDVLMKGGELLVSIIKGNPISAVRKGYQMFKRISKAKGGEKMLPDESYEVK